MKKLFKVGKYVLVFVLAIMLSIPFTKVNAATITGKPRITTELKSSENNIYSYDVGLNFEDWLLPAQEGETPYCLIDGWILYEKINNEYKKIYSTDTSDPDFESPYSIEVKSGESRTFAVVVYTENGAVSDYSDDVVLDHRELTTVVAKVAHGNGCFTISGEGINDKICETTNKTYQVPAGTTVTVKAIPDTGYSFDGWYVFDVETGKISVVVQSTALEYSFTTEALVEGDVETIAAAFYKSSYEVIEGADQTYTVDNNTEAEFEIDADYNLFKEGGKVYVDDILVDPENYTSRSGSTIITLKKEFVDTLSEGEHTLKVVFNDDKTATTSFNVVKNTPNKEETNTETNSTNTKITNPKTGDNILYYVLMLVLSLIGFSKTLLLKNN